MRWGTSLWARLRCGICCWLSSQPDCSRYYAPWISDDWRVSGRLTINLGLRWDFNVAPDERFNRLNRGFDTATTNPVDSMVDRAQFPNVPTLRGGLLFAGVGGQPREAADVYRKAIQPRMGFAYRITDDLVLRGGWGRYYINPSNNYIQTTGFSIQTPLVTSLDSSRTPIPNLINNPFPTGILQPPGAANGLLTTWDRG
jgi:TonB dependent receptor